MSLAIRYTVQEPFQGKKIYRACADLACSTRFQRVTGFYAFASKKGAELLAASLGESKDWLLSLKRWVISIDGGITEPSALAFLLDLPNSEVRVPNAQSLMENRLRPVRRFHPKTLLLEQKRDVFSPGGLLVGSANMTLHGLSLGHEHAMSLSSGATSRFPAEATAAVACLHDTFENSTEIGHEFVERYARMRPAQPSVSSEDQDDERSQRILQDRAVIPPQEAVAFASMSNFWIEVRYVVPNRGPGNEGNQIDMKRGSRVFFGFGDRSVPRNTVIGDVNIRYNDHASVRSLRFGNNSMDKLTLPIPGAEGPESYSNATVLFTREGNDTFRMLIGTPREIAAWRRRSQKNGTLFSLSGGRAFGLF
jgi:HKD family nuclease